jgi:hypothetical protein
VDALELGPLEEAPAHRRLVGDDGEDEAGLVEAAEVLEDRRRPLELVPAQDVVVAVDVDDAVAVQEDGGAVAAELVGVGGVLAVGAGRGPGGPPF